MDSGQLDKLVEKIADKIGVAVDKVEPVMAETVEQYVVRSIFFGVFWLALAIFFVCLGVWGIKKINQLQEEGEIPAHGEESAPFYILSGFPFVIALFMVFASGDCISGAIAPLPSIFGL